MISWGGMLSVTVRRLTRTIRSRDGISSCSPGPRTSVSRPSRNTMPRSYSRSTRTALATAARATTSSTARMTMMTVTIDAPLEQLPFLGRAYREGEPVQMLHDDRVAAVKLVILVLLGAGRPPSLPQRPVDGHAARRVRPAAHSPDVADDALRPGAHPEVPHRGAALERGAQDSHARTGQGAAGQQRDQDAGAEPGDRQHDADGHHQHADTAGDAVAGIVRFRDRHDGADHQ